MRGGAVPGAALGAARRGGGGGRGVRGGGGRGVQPRLHRAPPPPHLPGERPVERRHGGVPPRHLPPPPHPAARHRGVPGAGHFTNVDLLAVLTHKKGVLLQVFKKNIFHKIS